jgi:hypothetical protein
MKNIIIGAGPAGLQLGYFFQKAGIEYVILEKNAIAASFFDIYPHSGKLISINKKNTGRSDPEFNMRHDWNSLLADDDVRFTQYSNDYYPNREDLLKYLNEYAKRHSLNIQYNTTVNKIIKDGAGYKVLTSAGDLSCEKLIVAIGLSKPVMPQEFKNRPEKIYHYSQYEKDYFRKEENLEKFVNKTVLLVGDGNSAYELGNLLSPYCATVTISGRARRKFAVTSHYAGDIRSIYTPFLDTFFLKSLNGMGEYNFTEDSIFPINYDLIICCTGWTFDRSIFDFVILLGNKYPVITPLFESMNNKNLYFIGSLMHSLDFRKSSGGFIHGFRYLIKFFFQTFYTKYDTRSFQLEDMISHICYRINNSSALYQMFGQLVDIFYYDTDKFIYYESIKPDILSIDNYFILSLEYGDERDHLNTLFRIKRTYKGHELNGTLLHPVLKVFKNKLLFDEIHFDEDLIADFRDPVRYYDKFLRTIKMFI